MDLGILITANLIAYIMEILYIPLACLLIAGLILLGRHLIEQGRKDKEQALDQRAGCSTPCGPEQACPCDEYDSQPEVKFVDAPTTVEVDVRLNNTLFKRVSLPIHQIDEALEELNKDSDFVEAMQGKRLISAKYSFERNLFLITAWRNDAKAPVPPKKKG